MKVVVEEVHVRDAAKQLVGHRDRQHRVIGESALRVKERKVRMLRPDSFVDGANDVADDCADHPSILLANDYRRRTRARGQLLLRGGPGCRLLTGGMLDKRGVNVDRLEIGVAGGAEKEGWFFGTRSFLLH